MCLSFFYYRPQYRVSISGFFITEKNSQKFRFITTIFFLNVGFITGKRVNEEAATGHAS